MSSAVGAAAPEARQDAGDSLLVLTTKGQLKLTKTWRADGTISATDQAKWFSHTTVRVGNILELSTLLKKLEGRPRSAVVRGSYQGQDADILRRLEFIKDQPLHTMLVDVDGFYPLGADPVQDPQAAIDEFIMTMLPEPFRGASYHWQLSTSAGHHSKDGQLRAHLWFWLATPYTSAQLKAWAKRTKVPVDHSLFTPVQLHYTANPVFEAGQVDPCVQRSGFVNGLLADELYLDLTAEDAAAEGGYTQLERERDLGDIDDVVVQWLDENWEVRGIDNQGRVHVRCPWDATHTSGGGAQDTSSTYLPAGVGRAEAGYKCLHQHCEGHSVFDFLRTVGYDRAEDDFAVVEELEVVSEDRATREALLANFTAQVMAAQSLTELAEVVAPRIAANTTISDAQREMLVGIVKKRTTAMGNTMTVATVRGWLAPKAVVQGFTDVGEFGEVKATLENFRDLMRRLGIVLRYNVIRKDVDVLVPGVHLSSDNRDNAARAYLLSECERVGMPTRHVDSYMVAVADENQYNPVMTWIESKPWDGRSRLQELYDTVHSTAPHKEMVIRKWLVSCVAAASRPEGISAQGVLTFQGGQNKGKSTWFKRLTPSNLELFKGEYALKVQDKDSVLTAMGYWIVELGELDATFSKSELSNLKNFVTNQVDKLRRPYAARDSKMARRTVFCATVNPPEFLRDPTGNRRFWCVPVTGFTWDHQIDMQQLWAEVYELVKSGERWNLASAELDVINAQNEQFLEVDAWHEKLAITYKWDSPRDTWRRMSPVQVATECGAREPSTGVCRQVAAALRKLSGEHVYSHAGAKHYLVPREYAENSEFDTLD